MDPSEEASLLRNSIEGVGEIGFGEFGVGEIGFGEFGVGEIGDGAGDAVLLDVCWVAAAAAAVVWPPLAAAAELFVSSVALLISPRLLAKQRLTLSLRRRKTKGNIFFSWKEANICLNKNLWFEDEEEELLRAIAGLPISPGLPIVFEYWLPLLIWILATPDFWTFPFRCFPPLPTT